MFLKMGASSPSLWMEALTWPFFLWLYSVVCAAWVGSQPGWGHVTSPHPVGFLVKRSTGTGCSTARNPELYCWALLAQLQDKVKDIMSRERYQRKARRNWRKQASSLLLLPRQKQPEDNCGVSHLHVFLMFGFSFCDGKPILDARST